jgi:hypothetical protein
VVQATGAAIVGELTGTQLSFVPAPMIFWKAFKDANPGSLVLSRETGFVRSYGRNPYPGYDDIDRPPFLYEGLETPHVLTAVARILAVELWNETVAYPYDTLSGAKVVDDRMIDEDIVIFWAPGTAFALDESHTAEGEDAGSVAANDRVVDGQILSLAGGVLFC